MECAMAVWGAFSCAAPLMPDLSLAFRERLQTTPCCWVQPELNQIEFHPYLQQPELAAFCKEHCVVLETYSPLMSLTHKRGELAADRWSRTAGHSGPDAWQICRQPVAAFSGPSASAHLSLPLRPAASQVSVSAISQFQC